MRQRMTWVAWAETSSVVSWREDAPPMWVTTMSGPVPDLQAGAFEAAAEINLFVVEEEAGVEEADFAEGFGTDDGEGSGDPVNLGGEVFVGPSAVEAAEEAGAGEPGGEAGEDEGVGEDGVEAAGGGLGGAVGADEAAAAEGAGRGLLHVAEGEREGSGREEGIGVEEDEEAALGLVDGEIVGCAKTEVGVRAEEGDVGELTRDHVGGAVA